MKLKNPRNGPATAAIEKQPIMDFFARIANAKALIFSAWINREGNLRTERTDSRYNQAAPREENLGAVNIGE